MKEKITNEEFSDRVAAVALSRDKWIGLIESRLHDLTGLKLTLDKAYPYPHSEDNKDTTSIKTGKTTVVSFNTDKIAEALGTDDLFEVWQFILGHIRTEDVFIESEKLFIGRALGKEATKQLGIILDEIRRHDECGVFDVLGIFSASHHTIKIYAQVIAFYSIKSGIPAEDLAFVVLTHELAHAYTIAGYDINGSRGNMMVNLYGWDTNIIEGLAQYYTDAICRQLEGKYPNFKLAFEALLAKQTGPYTWHKNWLKKLPDNEKVRVVMLDYRIYCDSQAFERDIDI